jgi:hypothetical protein
MNHDGGMIMLSFGTIIKDTIEACLVACKHFGHLGIIAWFMLHEVKYELDFYVHFVWVAYSIFSYNG